MLRHINNTLEAIQRNDPAFAGKWRSLFPYPGLHSLVLHRLCHFLYRRHMRFLARVFAQLGRLFTNIEIHPGAKISSGVCIDHGAGVVIGETAVVEEGTLLYHGVTLGATGKDTGKRHPTLGKNVVVGVGAKVLGNIHIGDNSKIAANSVVLKDVPPGATVAGIPAKVVRLDGKPVARMERQMDLRQLQEELALLLERVCALECPVDEKKVVSYPGSSPLSTGCQCS